MYLFDTDILSNLLKRNPSPVLLRRLATLPSEAQFTSAITVGELIYGAYRSERPDYFLRKLEQLVWPNIIVLPFDEKAARSYGRLRAELEEAGTPLSEPDMRIASIALANNLTLVTANIQHFLKVKKLQVENWLIE
jgi:tRNA(fMet)-specific endonuclease VapC